MVHAKMVAIFEIAWNDETAKIKRSAGQEYTKKDYLACPLLLDDLRKNSFTSWNSEKFSEVERSVTSSYHGSKISGSQLLFLTKTVICIDERQKKTVGYRFVLECNQARESHTCQFFRFFCYIGTDRDGFCWDPERLLPWQRDVTTSPLYGQMFWRHS